MPPQRRKDSSSTPSTPSARPAQSPKIDGAGGANEDVRRFAQLVRAAEDKARSAQANERRRESERRQDQERREAEVRRLDDARAGKERAARILKERRTAGASVAAVAEAEAAYRAALAELLTIEQGSAPAWARGDSVDESIDAD